MITGMTGMGGGSMVAPQVAGQPKRTGPPSKSCNTLQRAATHCNMLQHTATHCKTLQHTATYCSTLQHTATLCNLLQHAAFRGELWGVPRRLPSLISHALQHAATNYKTLQHAATNYKTLQHTKCPKKSGPVST